MTSPDSTTPPLTLPRWLPLTVLLGLTVQFFWVTWHFAKQDSRLEQVERMQAFTATQLESISRERDRIIVLEQKLEHFGTILIEMNDQIRELVRKDRSMP